MSKSAESDMSRINLTDDADTIAKKIKKAKTDAEPVPTHEGEFEGRAEAKNLMTIYAALADIPLDQVFNDFGGQSFADFKRALTDVAVSYLEPVTSKMNELLAAPEDIDEILRIGADKANDMAAPMVKETMDIMGFWK